MKLRKKILAASRFGLMLAGLTIGGAVSFAQAQAATPQPAANPRGTPIRPSGSAWNPKSIAYLKASNATKDDQFGFTVALSGDGNTMAVGSTAEDSAAKGINGNQADHSALNAGAVYVFARNGGALGSAGLRKGVEHQEGRPVRILSGPEQRREHDGRRRRRRSQFGDGH